MINSWLTLALYVFKATLVILFRIYTEDIVLLPSHYKNDFLFSSKGSRFCGRTNKVPRELAYFFLFFLVLFCFCARRDPNLLTGRQRHSMGPVASSQSKRKDCVTILCRLGVKREAKDSVPVLLFPTRFASPSPFNAGQWRFDQIVSLVHTSNMTTMT